MRKACFAVLIILLLATTTTANRYMKNSPIGFRGVKWGDPPSALGNSYMLVEDHYIREGDGLAIGDARLSTIIYRFWKNRLEAVFIQAPRNQFPALRDAMFLYFGLPYKPDKYEESYMWQDNNALILLVERGDEGMSDLIFLSMGINELRNSKERLKKKMRSPAGF